jgi:hypothetical protein
MYIRGHFYHPFVYCRKYITAKRNIFVYCFCFIQLNSLEGTEVEQEARGSLTDQQWEMGEWILHAERLSPEFINFLIIIWQSKSRLVMRQPQRCFRPSLIGPTKSRFCIWLWQVQQTDILTPICLWFTLILSSRIFIRVEVVVSQCSCPPKFSFLSVIYILATCPVQCSLVDAIILTTLIDVPVCK